MAICYLIKQFNSRKKTYYKIGVSSSKNQTERLKNLQIGNPHKLVIIKTHKLQTKHLAEKLEQYILRELDSSNIKRCQGEWVFGDSKKIELTFNNCFKKFSLLKEEDIKNMKRWSFGRGGLNPSIALQKSLKVRRSKAKSWRKDINLMENIKIAIQQLEKPTLQKIAQILNDKGFVTIRGAKWSPAHLTQQLQAMGFKKWHDLI